MHPFLAPMKTLENRKILWCFQGLEKGYIWKEWFKMKLCLSLWLWKETGLENMSWSFWRSKIFGIVADARVPEKFAKLMKI